MRSEIPLTPEQLEAVFDSLDVNNNGYLTIEQFLSGFGEYKNGVRNGNVKYLVQVIGLILIMLFSLAVPLCRLVGRYQRFGETSWHHFQGAHCCHNF
jgi:hypothetical protein